MAKFRFHCSNGYANAKRVEIVEIPDEEFKGMGDRERVSHIESWHSDWMSNFLDCGWEEVADDENADQ